MFACSSLLRASSSSSGKHKARFIRAMRRRDASSGRSSTVRTLPEASSNVCGRRATPLATSSSGGINQQRTSGVVLLHRFEHLRVLQEGIERLHARRDETGPTAEEI